MHLLEIWRYPVKSMGGERLNEALLGTSGIPGDRAVQVYDRTGRLVTARRYPKLLRHRVVLGANGEPLVDGRPWNDVEVAREVERDVSPGARLEHTPGVGRFDVLPLLVATDGAIAAFGRDGRRLRPNLVIGGVSGLAERGWEGTRLAVGQAIVKLEQLRQRCVMTTYDPDTQEQDVEVLRSIVERFDGRLALNAEVERPGRIRVGDRVVLLRQDRMPS